jgi:putative ABC transport system permease protein
VAESDVDRDQTIGGEAGVHAQEQPAIFTPFSQTPASFFWNYLMVRTKGDQARVAASLRAAVASVDPGLEIGPVRRMDEIVAESVARPRFNAVLLSSLSMLAFILAALGIYGVVSYGVTQRTQEIAVRMALGAGSREVLRLVLSHGLRYALAGIALGVPLGLAATKVLIGLLFQIQPTDAATFLMAALFLCLVNPGMLDTGVASDTRGSDDSLARQLTRWPGNVFRSPARFERRDPRT